MRITIFIICVLFLSAESRAQQSIVSETVIDEYALNSINLFRELLSIPNDANNPSDIEKISNGVNNNSLSVDLLSHEYQHHLFLYCLQKEKYRVRIKPFSFTYNWMGNP